jgi:hypothetical protein
MMKSFDLMWMTVGLFAAVAGLGLQAPMKAHAQVAAVCRADIAKACAGLAAGGGRVSQCMQQSLDQASTDCRAHARAVSIQIKETRQPCADELLLFCAGGDLTEQGIPGCLQRNRAVLSSACQRLADRMVKRR